MSNPVQGLRAFRPSAYRDADPLEEQVLAIVRARNVVRYANMVRHGVRLFESDGPAADMPAASRPNQAPVPPEQAEAGPGGS